jgi:hypothetical protein
MNHKNADAENDESTRYCCKHVRSSPKLTLNGGWAFGA